jgi:hypothetical protein
VSGFIRVFLDSSDYSVMSDPKRMTPELELVRDSLLRHKASGAVRYYFSSTIVAEMTPTSVEYRESAIRRFGLLRELCGLNSLIWHEDLLRGEVLGLLQIESPKCPCSESGGWLPLHALGGKLDLFEDTDREGRRRVQRAFRKSLKKGEIPRELLSFPFPDSVKIAIAKSAAGDGDGADIMGAIAQAFADPHQFLAHLLEQPAQCRSFSDILRDSAQSVMDSVVRAMNAAEQARRIAPVSAPRAEWMQSAGGAIENIFKDLAGYFLKQPLNCDVGFEEIRSSCPGLFALLNTAYEAWWQSMVPTPRRPSVSDFVDALHATYSPYVDVFRADQFMASHVAGSMGNSGATVVARLNDLPSAIEARLRSAQ